RATHGANQTLHIRILPWRSRRDRSVADAHGSHSRPESMSIGAVIVAYEVGSRCCPGKGLGDLSVTSRSAAALRGKWLANCCRFGPSLPTTHGGTIAAVCSRCQSPRNLRSKTGPGKDDRGELDTESQN